MVTGLCCVYRSMCSRRNMPTFSSISGFAGANDPGPHLGLIKAGFLEPGKANRGHPGLNAMVDG